MRPKQAEMPKAKSLQRINYYGTMRYAFAYAIFLPQMPLVRIQEERTILWDIRQGSPPRLEQDTDLLSLRSN